MDWYQGFLLCVFLLWLGSTERDRNALRIVLIASLASEGIVDFITRQIHAPWKLAIPGAVEVLTILALFQWAKNRTGHLNVGALCAAWLAHLFCYVDACQQDYTGFFYANYETIIMIVAVVQLASFYDTMLHSAGRAYLWATGLWSVPVASSRSAVLHSPRSKGV